MPAAKIPQWRHSVKGSTIHSINGVLIRTVDDAISTIKSLTTNNIIIKLIQPNPKTIHDETGLPQLNFNQIVSIAGHHQDIIGDNIQFVVDNKMDAPDHVQISKVVTQTLTRAKLKKRMDWPQWEKSEFLQLDQYD